MLATAGFTSHLSVTEDQWVRKQSQTKQSPPVAKRGDAWLDGECKLFRLMTDFFFRVQLAKISSYLCLRAFLQKENEMQGRFFNCALSHIIMYLRHPMTATKHPSHAHTHTHTEWSYTLHCERLQTNPSISRLRYNTTLCPSFKVIMIMPSWTSQRGDGVIILWRSGRSKPWTARTSLVG